jgi:ABC-type ATPase with predicted acetyltransferase domain
LEALDLACYQIDLNATVEFRKRILLYYVHQFASGKLNIERLSKAHEAMLKSFPSNQNFIKKRLSMKVSKMMVDEFNKIVDQTSLSKTVLLKSLVAEIKSDILDKGTPKRIAELKTLSFMAGG